MSFNLHQTPEEIIKAATPEQRILWNFIFRQFGERVALSQLFYIGATAGSEFLTYTARKLYLPLNFKLSSSSPNPGAAAGQVVFYNELNVIVSYAQNSAMNWNVTTAAANFFVNSIEMNTLYFSRIALTTYNHMIFNGYRLQY